MFEFTHIILNRSLDALLAAAALLSTVEVPERVRFTFTAPDEIGPFPFAEWPARSRVVFVGPLAGTVNASRGMVALLRALTEAGHVVVGILDLNYEAWRKAMVEAADLPHGRDPLVGHDLRLFPQRAWTTSTGAPFEGSVVEPFLNQRRAEMGEGTLALCQAALGFLRRDPGSLRTHTLFTEQLRKGDWAAAHLLRALAQKPLAAGREWESTATHATFLRTEANHVAILAEANQSGPTLFARVGGLEVDLPELRTVLLTRARFAVISLSADTHNITHLTTRMPVDLLAIAKQMRIQASGLPHAIDVAPEEVEGILAVAIQMAHASECAS